QNTADITTNTNSINQNTTDIATNTTNINNLSDSITTLTDDALFGMQPLAHSAPAVAEAPARSPIWRRAPWPRTVQTR
ncbi:autotransporter, partial [Salmonella enterica subsp. enterica serovar Enteritidis str. 639672-50]